MEGLPGFDFRLVEEPLGFDMLLLTLWGGAITNGSSERRGDNH